MQISSKLEILMLELINLTNLLPRHMKRLYPSGWSFFFFIQPSHYVRQLPSQGSKILFKNMSFVRDFPLCEERETTKWWSGYLTAYQSSRNNLSFIHFHNQFIYHIIAYSVRFHFVYHRNNCLLYKSLLTESSLIPISIMNYFQ